MKTSLILPHWKDRLFDVYAKERAISEKNIFIKMKYQYISNQFLRITRKYRENDI